MNITDFVIDGMRIEVEKLTGEGLLHAANSFTSGRESKQSLKSAYRMGHSTIRTQIFFVGLHGIPQFVAYHLRTHFTLYPMAPMEYGWMRSKRVDKGGGDFRDVCYDMGQRIDVANQMVDLGLKAEALNGLEREVKALPDKYDRYAPTDFGFMISAEGLMTMAQKRLCVGAVSKETREVVEGICEAVREVDADLYPHLVKPCVATGICREKCCGFIRSELFGKLRREYKSLFADF